MAMRKTPLVDGEYYHIYSRGNSKQKIFLDKKDYEYFIKLLYCCNSYKNFSFREDVVKEGIEAFAFSPGDKLKWIAKVSNGDHSWAIYYHFADATNKIIKEYGIKVKDLETIKRLVPCTDEMLTKYRY